MKQVREAILEGINPIGANANEIRFVLPIVGRARIHAILINQYAGSKDGYFLELYGNYAACPTNFPTVDAQPPAVPNSPANYLVQPTMVVAAAASAGVFRDNFGVPYTNTANSIASRVDEIYCRLSINSGDSLGSKFFDLRVLYTEQDS